MTLKEIRRITRVGGTLFFQVSHPIYNLFCKPIKDYELREDANFMAAGSNIMACHRTFTFEDYMTAILSSGWRLLEVREHFGPRSVNPSFNGFRIPTLITFRLINLG